MENNMFFQEYLQNMCEFNKLILDNLNNDDQLEISFNSISKYFNDHNIHQNKNDLKLILRTIIQISNHHHRTPNFFAQIEQILKLLMEDVKKQFTNFEIFDIFKESKRLLLFLFSEQVIIPDAEIYRIITKEDYFDKKYPHYFYSEFKQFFDDEMVKLLNSEKDVEYESESFYENRKIGENQSDICIIIRDDNVEEFKKFYEKNRFFYSSQIKSSIFETNPFLYDKELRYSEYSAFCGSMNIIKFLISQKNDLRDSVLLYAVHSSNQELIELIENTLKIQSTDDSIINFFLESLKCHHVEIANSIYSKYFTNGENKIELPFQCLKFYNFINFNSELISKLNGDISENEKMSDLFSVLCECDYITFVDFILRTINVDVNAVMISNIYFF